MKRHRGFALLAVLWVVVALGGITVGAVASVREGGTSSSERVLLTRARWAAEACQAFAAARLEELNLARQRLTVPSDTLRMANGTRCSTEGLDPGTRVLDDSTSWSVRLRLDSILTASGDTSRTSRDTFLTRHGSGRININAAPASVLLALPGMSHAAVQLIMTERTWDRPISDLSALAYRLPPAERQLMLSHWPELAGRIALAASALVVTSRGWTDGTLPEAVIQVLAVPAGNRIAIVRRRTW